MGYDFVYLNLNLNTFSKDIKEYWMTKNIHNGNSKSHIINIVKKIIKDNNWKESDTIVAKSCAHKYVINLEKDIFIDEYYQEKMTDKCSSTYCNLC